MKIPKINNYNPLRYIKSLYYANRQITYKDYPAKLKPDTNFIKKLFNKLKLK